MRPDREREVTEAFVALASRLASGYDVLDLLSTLVTDCVRLLDVTSAGLLLADNRGVLHVMAASSERLRDLEIFQLQRDEGPCLDCYRGREAVSIPDLDEERDRWPQFVPAALTAGFASVHALPMRLGENTLGALGLFGANAGALEARDLTLGQALADVASVALLQEKAVTDHTTVNAQLQHALTSRVVLEQAKGLIAQQGNLDMAQAFAVLRLYARDHNLRLAGLAKDLVERTVPGSRLLDHAKAKGALRI